MIKSKWTCKTCGHITTSLKDANAHKRDAHGIVFVRNKQVNPPESAFERIHRLKKELQEALNDLDAERNKAQQHIIELDNLVAKSKAWVN